jgi:hypothetical protein
MSDVAFTWTNKDIQNNPRGYLEAQRREREQAEVERKKAEEQDDFERFARAFIAWGGDPSQSREMYKRYKNDMALQAAKEYDRATRERMRNARYEAV